MIADLLQNGSILQIVATFIALSLIVSTLLCLLFIIWGGINFILSAGNEERIKKAMATIRYAIVGVVVTFGAFFIVAALSRLLDIPFNLSFTDISDLMQQIFESLRG